jgi:hypothetical protein
MGYGDVILFALVGLTVRFALTADASARAKWIVGGLCLTSLFGGRLVPVHPLVGMFLMLAICVYIILHERLSSPESGRSDDPQDTRTDQRSGDKTPAER